MKLIFLQTKTLTRLFLALAVLNLAPFAWSQDLQTAGQPRPPSKPAAATPSTPLALGMAALIKTGTLTGLRWGQFADYRARLEALYQSNAYTPLWTQGDKPTAQAKQVIAQLASADEKGLNAEDYDAALLNKWAAELANQATANPNDLANFEVGLSLNLMRYSSNLYKGRINPRQVNFNLDIEPKKEDLPALLVKIAKSDKPVALIENLEPKLKLYEYLKNALAHYRKLAKDEAKDPIALPNKFKQGASHAEVPKLRKRLALLGELPETGQNEASTGYDQTLADAVKSFQSHHGLTADGVIGKSTLAQLNYPISERITQIQLGLERMRWLPEHIEGRYIMVNIPSFQLFGFHRGSASERADLEMNVIVGEAIDGRSTPVFHSDMTYVNFRPYWNVPPAIATKEYVPILRRNPGYLAKNNMEIAANYAPNATTYSASPETIDLLEAGNLKLRQKPGPKNALGLVKFAFPNTNNVYLHSTPSQGLFKRTRRDFSHGCIRVEFPVQLAEFVLKDYEDWTTEKIEAAMQQEKPSFFTLKTPIPVYIFYSTVLADADGRAMFYQDLYGHDKILAEQLAKGFPYAP